MNSTDEMLVINFQIDFECVIIDMSKCKVHDFWTGVAWERYWDRFLMSPLFTVSQADELVEWGRMLVRNLQVEYERFKIDISTMIHEVALYGVHFEIYLCLEWHVSVHHMYEPCGCCVWNFACETFCHMHEVVPIVVNKIPCLLNYLIHASWKIMVVCREALFVFFKCHVHIWYAENYNVRAQSQHNTPY